MSVFAGEVDAVSTASRNGQEHSHYVEMKTTREIDNHRQDINFKRYTIFKYLDRYIHRLRYANFLLNFFKIIFLFICWDSYFEYPLHMVQKFEKNL